MRNLSLKNIKIDIPHVVCSPEERSTAARIIAECQDKPIKRITHSKDIPGQMNKVTTPTGKDRMRRMSKASIDKRDKILAYLEQHGPTLSPVLDTECGGIEAARGVLEMMWHDAQVTKTPTWNVVKGSRKRCILWGLA